MKTLSRKYKYKDVEMLLAAASIVESAILHKELLQKLRSSWTDDFFQNLKVDIEFAIQNQLGNDKAKELRQATLHIQNFQEQILNDLSQIRLQIREDFKHEPEKRDEILNTLGMDTFYANESFKSQKALIKLLVQFKANLTPQLKQEIIAKGTEQTLIESFLNYPIPFIQAELNQEFLKGTRKTQTSETLETFNEIYSRTISLASIAYKLLLKEPVIRDQFSFKKIVKNFQNKPIAQ